MNNIFSGQWTAPKRAVGMVQLAPTPAKALQAAPPGPRPTAAPVPQAFQGQKPVPLGPKASCPVCRTFGGM